MPEFKDHFSGHSESYAKYRPTYPASLFKYLSEIAPDHDIAWDCATGNGQAAAGLSPYFKKIVATDASHQQIEKAQPLPNVEYKEGKAEESAFADNSIDLISVAQALHWFKFDAFFAEVLRVLKSGGILAVWSYNLFHSDTVIDKIIKTFYSNTLHSCWPPERVHVENNYSDIVFPLDEISAPVFKMIRRWNFNELLGYISTWSAVQNYNNKTGQDCIKQLSENLKSHWQDGSELKEFEWPLTLRVFKKAKL